MVGSFPARAARWNARQLGRTWAFDRRASGRCVPTRHRVVVGIAVHEDQRGRVPWAALEDGELDVVATELHAALAALAERRCGTSSSSQYASSSVITRISSNLAP